MKRRDAEGFWIEAAARGIRGEITDILRSHAATVEELLDGTKDVHASAARAECFALMSERYGWSDVSIGKFFGFDRTSVWTALHPATKQSRASRRNKDARPGEVPALRDAVALRRDAPAGTELGLSSPRRD